MVVAFDIDGTITRHPAFFACISRGLLASGWSVVIITFREDRVATARDLRSWGVEYTHLVTATTDAPLSAGVDEWKAGVCREHGVQMLFEDDARVLVHLDASVVPMLVVDPSRHDLAAITRPDAL